MPHTVRGRAQFDLALVSAYCIGAGLALGLLVGGGWLVAGYIFCAAGALMALGLVLDLLAP